MRVLKFLFISFLVMFILLMAGFYISREIMMDIGVRQVEASIKQLDRLYRDGSYITDCMDMGSAGSEIDQIVKFQIRFLNKEQYLVEAVCVQFPSKPIEISRSDLPGLVEKRAGSSGLIWGQERSGFVLDAMGKSKSFIVENGDYNIASLEKDQLVDLGIYPDAKCEEFGFVCCDDFSEQGQGDLISGVSDCSKNCYSSCLNRPLVLSFTSQPFMDRQSRTVELIKGQEIDFYYTVSGSQRDLFDDETDSPVQILKNMINWFGELISKDKDSNLNEKGDFIVSLDFGDGNSEQFYELQTSTKHSYDCNQASCSYTAALKVTDQNLESNDSPLAKIRILVK